MCFDNFITQPFEHLVVEKKVQFNTILKQLEVKNNNCQAYGANYVLVYLL